jgi:hypothetical protein
LWRFLCLLAFIFLLSPLYFPKGGKWWIFFWR